jgi:ABC-type molybdate transport system permease subunit
VAHLTAVTAIRQLDPEFEAVGASLKVPAWTTFGRVTVPICLPVILDIAVYLFVNAMTTVSAVVFLYGLRESHIYGMICQVPALEEAVETKEAPGDGLWSGWLVAAGRVAGPAAEAADDPGEPRQAP